MRPLERCYVTSDNIIAFFRTILITIILITTIILIITILITITLILITTIIITTTITTPIAITVTLGCVSPRPRLRHAYGTDEGRGQGAT